MQSRKPKRSSASDSSSRPSSSSRGPAGTRDRGRGRDRDGGARQNRHADLSKGTAARDESDIPKILAEAGEAPLILVLDGVQDPHNLGACLRSADAAGVTAVIVPKDRAVHLTQTVRKIACGAAESVPFVAVTNLARCLRDLKKAGLWLVGTADEATQSIYDVELHGPTVIVMGAEGAGVRRLTSEECDYLVRIPMAGSVECLNVSVATGVCLFESVRQRLAKK